MKHRVLTFLLGVLAGASLLIGGMSIARTSSKNACMNRPLGSCWVDDSPLAWVIKDLGNLGLTPIMGTALFVALALLMVLIYFSTISSTPNHPFKNFARGVLTGVILGILTFTLL